MKLLSRVPNLNLTVILRVHVIVHLHARLASILGRHLAPFGVVSSSQTLDARLGRARHAFAFAPRDSSSSSPCVRAHRSRRSRRPQTRSQRSPPRSPTPIARAIRVTRVSLRFLPRIFSTRVALTIGSRFVIDSSTATLERDARARAYRHRTFRARARTTRGVERHVDARRRGVRSRMTRVRVESEAFEPGGRDGGRGTNGERGDAR